MAMQTKNAFYLLTGLILVPPCLFFTYYTARLLYINLTMDDAAAHRTGNAYRSGRFSSCGNNLRLDQLVLP
jgi:hypothetical protein